MTWVIVGLGNPGSAYRGTRHNVGRDFVEALGAAYEFEAFTPRARAHAITASGMITSTPVTLVLPEVFMNESARAVMPFVRSVAAARKLIVVRDDLDQPIGAVKLTLPGRGSGGQKGVESVAAGLRTKDFYQLKIGISPVDDDGKIKKHPKGDAVLAHVLGRASLAEQEALAKAYIRGQSLIETLITKKVVHGSALTRESQSVIVTEDPSEHR